MKKMTWIVFLAVIALVFATGFAMAAEPVTIQGQVNENSQLVDDNGEVYDIAETTDEGMQVMELVGEQIEVRGTLTEDAGVKEITVESFDIRN
jgi:hypothetical protein